MRSLWRISQLQTSLLPECLPLILSGSRHLRVKRCSLRRLGRLSFYSRCSSTFVLKQISCLLLCESAAVLQMTLVVTLECVLASIRLDTEGIDLLCALLQVGRPSPVTPADLIFTLCALLLPQFDTRGRISAEAALRHSYFLSLGENIHNLPDSELYTSHQKQTEQPET